MQLDMQQRRALRARAHALKPVLTVGERGVSEALLAELELTLETHELIKVRLPAVARDERQALAGALTEASGAALVQSVGRIVVLYRKRRRPPVKKPREGFARARPRKPVRRRQT